MCKVNEMQTICKGTKWMSGTQHMDSSTKALFSPENHLISSMNKLLKFPEWLWLYSKFRVLARDQTLRAFHSI